MPLAKTWHSDHLKRNEENQVTELSRIRKSRSLAESREDGGRRTVDLVGKSFLEYGWIVSALDPVELRVMRNVLG